MNLQDLSDGDGAELASGGDADGYFGGCVPGCMNESACNYDDAADVDDGSCEFGAPIDYLDLPVLMKVMVFTI